MNLDLKNIDTLIRHAGNLDLKTKLKSTYKKLLRKADDEILLPSWNRTMASQITGAR